MVSAQSPQMEEGSADDSPARLNGCEEEEVTEREENSQNNNDDDDDDDEDGKVPQVSQRRLHPRGHRRAKKEGRQEQECNKPWDAPPPPEWLERHRQELWPTYDPSSYNWPELLADLVHTPVRCTVLLEPKIVFSTKRGGGNAPCSYI